MRQMAIPLIVASVLAFPLTAQAGNEEAVDYFKLWNDCEPILLGIETLPKDAAGIGLDKDIVLDAARKHLDEANLFKGEVTLESSEASFPPSSMLYVAVHVVGKAFGVDVDFKKWMPDLKSHEIRLATSWQISSMGTHSGIAENILSTVSTHTELFVGEYFRLNEDACTY